jgi:hypothetical protein
MYKGCTEDVGLGPHTADPLAQHLQADDGYLDGSNVLEQGVLGTNMNIYVYNGRGRCVSISCVSSPPFG